MEANGHKYAPVPGKIPGKALNLGGVEFIAAPMNLDGIQEAMALLEKMDGNESMSIADAIHRAAEVIIISLRRNNPDITLDDLVQLLDVENWEPALLAVAGRSGLQFRKPGESMPASP